jgi:hypothetical protein
VGDFAPLRVEFSYPEPPETSEHRRIFRAPVRFGAERIQLVLAREVWDQRNAHPNPGLCAMLEEHARRLLTELPSEGLVGEIRRLTTTELKGGRPTLEHVSGLVSMSGRTLQHRLRLRRRSARRSCA